MYSGNFFYPLSQTEIELCYILKIFSTLPPFSTAAAKPAIAGIP